MIQTLLVLLGLLLFLFVFTELIARLVRYQMPPRGKFVRVGEHLIHYLEKGSGPTVLLIHGLSGNALNFDYALMDLLAKNYRVVALDRPGAGHSRRSGKQGAALPDQAKVIADFIETLGLGRLFVVGHSLGGAVALQLVLDHPRLVRAVALIAPLTHFQEEVPAAFHAMRIRSPFLRHLYGRTLAVPRMILRGQKIAEMIFHPQPPPADFALRGGGYLGADYLNYCNSSADLVALEAHLQPLASRYSEIQVPVSILYGTEDKILDYRVHGLPMRELNSRFKVECIPGGHMLVTTHPELVRDFIDSAFRETS